MSKNFYREFFAKCMPFLRMRYFLNKAGVSPVAFSRFMKGSDFDFQLSIGKLESLYNSIIEEVQENIA